MRNVLQQARMELLPRSPALFTPPFPDAASTNRDPGLGAHHIAEEREDAFETHYDVHFDPEFGAFWAPRPRPPAIVLIRPRWVNASAELYGAPAYTLLHRITVKSMHERQKGRNIAPRLADTSLARKLRDGINRRHE